MGNSNTKQLNRGRSKSRILSPREWRQGGLLKRSKSQPLSTTSSPPLSPSSRKFTKREDKRPVDPEEEDDVDELDILSDEHEFAGSTINYEGDDHSKGVVYNEDIKLLPKQKLLLLQIELLRSIQDMCDISLPVAAILLHFYKWDKDKLVEKWIEDNEKLCQASGVWLPLLPRKLDPTHPEELFLPFKEEVKPQPFFPSPPSFDSTHNNDDANGVRNELNVPFLDFIRPLLVHRAFVMNSDEDTSTNNFNLNPIYLLNGLNNAYAQGGSSSSSSAAASAAYVRRRSMQFPLPLPPASPRISRRAPNPSATSIEEMEIAAVQLSLITQVQELFPELDEPFITACLREYRNSYELVVDHILESNLPSHLADRLKALRGQTNTHTLNVSQAPPPPPPPPASSASSASSSSLSSFLPPPPPPLPSPSPSPPPPLLAFEEFTHQEGGGGDDGAGGNGAGEEGEELEYHDDGASANAVSDTQNHSTVHASHEDFSENHNAWFTATHTDAENESLDSMTTNTNTSTYVTKEMHEAVGGGESSTLQHLRTGSDRIGGSGSGGGGGVFFPVGEDNLYVDNNYTYTGDNYNLTSEHTSINNVFDGGDNTSEDEEELIVRRKGVRKGIHNADVYDMSDDVYDNGNMSEEDEDEEGEGEVEGGEEESTTGGDKKEEWMDFVKVCDPIVPEHDNYVNIGDVYIPPEEDTHKQSKENDDVGASISVEINNNNEVESEFLDIDNCMRGIANELAGGVCCEQTPQTVVCSECTEPQEEGKQTGQQYQPQPQPPQQQGQEQPQAQAQAQSQAQPQQQQEQGQAQQQPQQAEEQVTCLVCYSESAASDTYCLSCNHVFCLECWRSHLITKLGEGLQSALTASCMNQHCKLVVDLPSWRRVLDEANFLKYQWFFLKSFVDNCPKAAWCSNPISCGNAAYYHGIDIPPVLNVLCDCGWKFCFHCGEEAHQPSSCQQLASWQGLRSGEEGQNALWLSQNTKRCPACKIHIEKNEGCMHLTCKSCDHEFCWLCKGPWAEHGDKTGGYYSCNRYDPLRHDTPDLDMRFGKYVHHFQRYTYHTNARKVAELCRGDIAAKEPTRAPGDDPWDRAFLYDVLDLVISCRHVLKFTYVFGFYLEDAKEKELFEFLQEDLEKATEHLSEVLFREVDNITQPITEREAIELLKISTKATRKFLDNLLTGIQNGLIDIYGPPSEVTTTQQKRKKLKDRKISRMLSMSK